ncbi:hypothetical protein QT235_17620 [Geobacillus stearothermophilus]|nr:hypothetical protein QT235_17620 [Geobacillus stearothermophilus]
MTFAFFYRASLGGPDERREQKFATLVGDHFGMSPTNILLTQCDKTRLFSSRHERTLRAFERVRVLIERKLVMVERLSMMV